MAKVYEMAARTVAELALDIQLEAQRDGHITPQEARLIRLARRASALAEVTCARQKAAQRIGGGGALDERMMAQLRAADRLLASAGPVVAQGGNGSGIHRKGGQLTYIYRAKKRGISVATDTPQAHPRSKERA